jgi:hypothetical protein
MDKKALFWSFYVNFCTFCASLRLIKHLFTRPKTSIISVNPVILSNLSSCSSCLYLLILAYLSSRSVKISVNPRLINDLRSTKDYVRKNKLFMQNKANFQKVKYDVNRVLTRDYDRMDTWSIRKNEPKTNPNEPKTNPIKANKMPKQTQFKPKQTQFQTAHCQIGLLPCIFCVDMAGLRRKHVTYYPGRVYNRMMWLDGCRDRRNMLCYYGDRSVKEHCL